jgi:hypothetical protein
MIRIIVNFKPFSWKFQKFPSFGIFSKTVYYDSINFYDDKPFPHTTERSLIKTFWEFPDFQKKERFSRLINDILNQIRLE